jgi:hypothetical protein
MVRSDENREAVAKIWISIDLYNTELQKEEESENISGGCEDLSEPFSSDQHWSLLE